VDKAAKGATLQKGFYDISDMACLLSSLKWLLSSYEWEQQLEAQPSETLAKLRTWMADGVSVLESMVKEEIAEWQEGTDVELAAGSGLMQKFLKPLLAKAATPAADATALQKAAVVPVTESQEFKDALEKAVGAATAKSNEALTALEKRLKVIEDQPAPARGVTKAITKGHDVAGTEQPDEVTAPVMYNGVEDPVATALKKSLSNPGVMTVGGSVIHK
jgi:hypothetical protein